MARREGEAGGHPCPAEGLLCFFPPGIAGCISPLPSIRGAGAKMSAEGCPGGEDPFTGALMEELKQRLRRAFRGERTERPAAAAAQMLGRPAGQAAQEELLRRAHVEGSLAWLRVELLEMKSQNQKLARTLLDLSMEIQRLRNENNMSAALESETLNTTIMPE